MTERETDSVAAQAAEQAPKPGLIRKARRTAGFFGRWYLRLQFGDVKGFVEEQKQFGRWVMRQVRRRDGRRESFNDAMQRLGLAESDLAARCTALERAAWMYGLVATLAFLLLLFSPFVKHSISQFLLSLGLFLLMGARCAASRFRIAQIRGRRFMGFLEWIKGEGSNGRIAG